MFFHQSITVWRAPVIADKYGNRVRDWATATGRAETGLSVQPAARTEEHTRGDRDTATTGWQIQTPPGRDLDLLATDRVELEDGVVCEVAGEVARHPDPWGRGVHHVEASVERVTG